MATEQEVIDARLQIMDNVDLEAAIAELAGIFASGDPLDIFVQSGDFSFNFSRLKAVLDSGNANEDAMITNVEAAIRTLVGASDVAIGSVRKELRDLVNLHDADIAAT